MIKIRNFLPADIDEILAIADLQLGEKYITVDDLSACNVIVAEDVELLECVGFCLSYVGQDDVAYVRTVAVNPDYSGQGIGTALVAKSVEYLKGIGARKIMSPLWKHDRIVNSDVIFRRNGFLPVREIPDYWYADSITKGYSCPVCGKGCHCTCVLYELKIESRHAMHCVPTIFSYIYRRKILRLNNIKQYSISSLAANCTVCRRLLFQRHVLRSDPFR